MVTAKQAFNSQKQRAKKRNILFCFTFQEWVRWWEEQLGPDWLRLRGKQGNQYCMGRFEDKGNYEASNVKLLLVKDNISERHKNNPKLGSKHHNSKIDEKAVRLIKESNETLKVLSNRFGISITQVWNIRTNKQRKR